MNEDSDSQEAYAGHLTRRGFAAAGVTVAIAAASASLPAEAAAPHPVGVGDRLDIQDLFSAYVWSYDCSDAEEFGALFTDDALVIGRGTVYRGREAILGWFRYLLDIRERDGDDTWMHEAGQFRFVPNGRSVIVYAYATHFNSNTATGTRGVRSLGYFVCECVKVGGAWKFRRFSYGPWDRKLVPWKKPLPWTKL